MLIVFALRKSAMIRQQFGLGLPGLRKPRLQHLRNALMRLLPGTLEQRLIGCLLNQGVFEEIGCLRQQSALIYQLRLHQLLQPLL